MNVDITRLPIGEMMIGFLVLVLGVTFTLAYTYVDSGEGDEAEVSGPAATPVTGSAQIVMGDNFFDPNDITVQAGDTITFDLQNQGAVTHNMRIAGSGGSYSESGICEVDGADPCSDPNSVTAGATAILTWEVPDTPGEIPFRCDFHPTDMTGTLTIVAASAGDGGGGEGEGAGAAEGE